MADIAGEAEEEVVVADMTGTTVTVHEEVTAEIAVAARETIAEPKEATTGGHHAAGASAAAGGAVSEAEIAAAVSEAEAAGEAAAGEIGTTDGNDKEDLRTTIFLGIILGHEKLPDHPPDE